MKFKLYLSLIVCSVAIRADDSMLRLQVDAGVPLRLYLTKRVPKRLGQPVFAKLAAPVFVFDRVVIPAGADVSGSVVALDPVPRWRRISALMGGDFTPLHQAQIRFTSIALQDGRTIPIESFESPGLDSLYSPTPTPKIRGLAKMTGFLGSRTQSRIQDAVETQAHGFLDMVKGPGKMERVQEYFVAKLPYHPQWVRQGTRFDAVLERQLELGSATLKPSEMHEAAQPPSGSIVQARLLTPVSSATAKPGDPVEAIVSEPLFKDGKLMLPEGTRLTGLVTMVQHAQSFHRGGQLRFTFKSLSLPEGMPMRTSAIVDAAEVEKEKGVAIDREGREAAKSPRTRLLGPALALIIATRSFDRQESRVPRRDSNVNRRVLAGFTSFGLFGTIAGRVSQEAGRSLGYYGLAWQVYLNLIARGPDVEFGNNAAMSIRFGGRTQGEPSGAGK